MRRAAVLSIVVMLAGCGGGGFDTVLQDFGLQERPEGYESGSDKVFARLDEIGQAELKRLNFKSRQGEIKFEEEQGVRGKYYKEVKVYERYFPLDARTTPRTTGSERGYFGYIDYEYRIFQGPRRSNRTEAAAESATIPTDTTGRETLRYRFSQGGAWEGGEGEMVN